MKTFTMYRKADLSATHSKEAFNPPDEPQFEGVIFSDGCCVIHWLTSIRSVSVWDSLEDMLVIHGHPEYESELVWAEEEMDESNLQHRDGPPGSG